MLFPGVYSRRDSLRIAGLHAVQLMLGILPMLVIAGLLEALCPPTELNPTLKFALGATLFSALLLYVSMPTRSIALPEDPER